MGRRFVAIEANLISIEPVQRILDETLAGLGRLDILVNNAGLIRRTDAVDFSEQDWDDVMNVNLKSAFFMSQAAGRHFITQGSGKIINIASMLSFQGGIRVPSYTASKSGIAGITRLLANEWGSKGVTANAIAPGYMATDNTAQLRADQDRNKSIWTASRPRAGVCRPTSAARRCSWPAAPRTTSTARSSRSTAAGWRAEKNASFPSPTGRRCPRADEGRYARAQTRHA